MNVTVPDSLRDFVDRQIGSGRFSTAQAYVEELIRTDAEMFERVGRGEPLPLDEHFDRRLESLLDVAERSGDYRQVTLRDFDAMEREALDLAQKRKSH